MNLHYTLNFVYILSDSALIIKIVMWCDWNNHNKHSWEKLLRPWLSAKFSWFNTNLSLNSKVTQVILTVSSHVILMNFPSGFHLCYYSVISNVIICHHSFLIPLVTIRTGLKVHVYSRKIHFYAFVNSFRVCSLHFLRKITQQLHCFPYLVIVSAWISSHWSLSQSLPE